MKNNEERIKSDQAQTVIDLNDQIESVRYRQATDDEERYMKQINDIKQTHSRERENLI